MCCTAMKGYLCFCQWLEDLLPTTTTTHKHALQCDTSIHCFGLLSVTHTCAWCLGADCVRMISTISANCDVAFCALTVIIADFTDLHITLPFPTSLLLLTYSLFPLLIRADRGPSTVASISYAGCCACVWGTELHKHSWNSQSIHQSTNQSGSPPLQLWSRAPACCTEPKWRLCFVTFLLVHCVLNTIALNTGSHAASPACVCIIPKQRSLKGSESISIKMYPTVRRLFSISRCRLRC